MKIKTIVTSASLAWCASLGAAPLGVSTAVQSQPDAASPVIAVLAAGAEQPPASAAQAPAGWTAVDLPGPFTGYVHNRDLTKQLDVAPGTSIFLAPKDDAGVLAVYAKGDKAEITGLRGGWTQLSLEKTLVGYISSAPPMPAAVAASAPASPAPLSAAPGVAAPAAVTSSSSPAPQGQAVPPARLFEGKLTSSESLLYPHRPFKWQLSDASGARIAYVNLESILMTDQIENYAGHTVVVLGSLRPVKETRDLVIDVEAFHLK
jgi:cell division septation protein DedD